MGGQNVGLVFPRLLAKQRGAQARRATQRREEAGCAIGIVSGARDRPHTDLVGFQFLLAREAGEGHAPRGLRLLAFLPALNEGCGLGDDRCIALQLGALARMAGRDMGNLMRHDGGDFGRIIGQREEPARHVKIAGGQCESIDQRGVEDGDAIGFRRRLGRQGETRQNAVQVELGGCGAELAAKQGDQSLVL